jgi:hypothetical protein
MTKMFRPFMVIAVVALAFGSLHSAAGQSATGATVSAKYTLAEMPLGEAQNSVLKGSITNDRKMLLGGIGSDVWHGPSDAANELWMITDRGPNGQIRVDDKNRRTFPVPEFTPLIVRVQLDGSAAKVMELLPILTADGKPVTGLSNLEKHDEVPWDFAAKVQLTYNQNGLDSEGLVRTTAGEFWVADEYSPSLTRLDATGKVIKRYVPVGLAYDAAFAPALPEIFGMRKVNRGFEGLAISADEKTLYLGLQSPLANPDRKVGDASRNTRILAFDIASEKPVAEYVYQFDDAVEFGGAENTSDEMKVSGLIAVSPTMLLVLERTDLVAKLYLVDLSKADNILGSAWDDAKTTPSLEAVTDLAAANVKALPKTLVLDLDKLDAPDKIEGIALIDKSTLVIANDNDFDIGDFDAEGNHIGAGLKSQVWVITLDTPLP